MELYRKQKTETTDKSKDNHKPTLLARMLSFLFPLHVWLSDIKQALWIVYVTVTISCYFNRCLHFLKMCKSTLSLLCTDCSGEGEEWSHTAGRVSTLRTQCHSCLCVVANHCMPSWSWTLDFLTALTVYFKSAKCIK